MGAATSPSGSPSRRQLWVALGALGAVLVVALIVVLVVWRGGAGTPSSDDSRPDARPTPTASATPLAVASAAPAASTPAGPRPTSCDEIYSPEMLATFGQTRTLNPEWTQAADLPPYLGTTDPDLSAVIEDTEHLTCVWAAAEGGSDSGLTTNVVFVTAETSEAVHQRLNAIGQNCYDEEGGIRCVVELARDADGYSGESHFLRDGIWLATHYQSAGPDGYTLDMVGTIWADS
jgi:hypothetical protein